MTDLNGQAFAKTLPKLPGVYQMLDQQGQVIYVGKARVLKNRVSSYFNRQAKDNKTMALVNMVSDMHYDVTRSDGEALILENQLIKKHKPKYNILLKDGKSYPYIYCSYNEDKFPRIEFRRGDKKGKGKYYGPYPSASSVRYTLNFLQKVFKVRQCNNSTFNNRSRPCLQHQINRCTAPCVGLVTQTDYQKQLQHTADFIAGKSKQVVKSLLESMDRHANNKEYEKAAEYRDQIKALRLIQSQQFAEADILTNLDVFCAGLESGIYIVTVATIRNGQLLGYRDYYPKTPKGYQLDEFLGSFVSQYYYKKNLANNIVCNLEPTERTAIEQVLSEISQKKIKIVSKPKTAKRKILLQTVENMEISLQTRINKYASWLNKWACWKNQLGLKKTPKIVECFDISHTFGEQTRASCVVFDQKGARKKDYRQYIIENINQSDDYAAMRQVIQKRLDSIKKHKLEQPDIFLIDGGKGQVNQAKLILQQNNINHIQIIGITKDENRTAGEERLYIPEKNIFIKPEAHELLSLMIQFIRDEAHRFAIKSHRNALKKIKKKSFLENIPGVGQSRRNNILKHFGGIQGLKKASLDDICKVNGISTAMAGKIFIYIHEKN